MSNPANALIVALAIFVTVCILSIISGHGARSEPRGKCEKAEPTLYLPCAQPMSPLARAAYTALIVTLLLASIGLNYWPSETPALPACQASNSSES